ncbi:phage/plasmid primase, P4 family [Burkholderia gladioli]|uniref:phage/plasmid primase, P4 family n=1 Tax=Burkholderia gladioli TaxID=28095 RepID=UPI0016416D66|nr:phage/plasmid primase, P4 family [Burkholderia gladioli]
MSRKYTDLTAADEVCTVTHGEHEFMVVAMQRDSGTREVRSTLKKYGTLEQLKPVLVDWSSQGLEAYMLVPTTSGKGHGNSHIQHTWALAVDFDKGLPAEIRADSPVAPTFLIETSPARYHAVWLLNQQCEPDEARRANFLLAMRLGGDPAFARKGQLVRLPGFANRKYEDHTVRLVPGYNRREPYEFPELMEAFDARVVGAILQERVSNFDSTLSVSKTSHEKDLLIEDVKSALAYLGHLAEEYGDWICVLMALIPLGEEGRVIAREFAAQSSKFTPQAFEAKWESLQNSEGSVRTIFALAQREGWSNPGFRNAQKDDVIVLTDRDFGRLIAEEIGEHYAATEIIADNQAKALYQVHAWNGETFTPLAQRDLRLAVERAGSEVLRQLLSDNKLDRERAKQLRHKIGSNRQLDDVCEHVAEALVPRSLGRVLSSYPYLGVDNGVINLATRSLMPAHYRVLPRFRAAVRYDPTARAPLFEKTIHEIFEEDEEMVAFMYRAMGYMLLGKPNEQIFLIFHGESGSNGKSVLTEVLSSVLAEYAMMLPTTTIMTKSHVNDGATPALARLQHKRLAIVAEPNRKHDLDSGMIKLMTGDRRMSIRNNYGPARDILLEFVLLMVTNFLPNVAANDNGIWRRIQIVPFNRKFGPDEIDPNLIEKLRAEASGILNVLLDGAADYLRGGLRIPAKITTMNQQQRHQLDPIEIFLEEMMIRSPDAETSLKIIYSGYEAWKKSNPRFHAMTKQELGKALEAKGFEKIKRGNLPHFVGFSPIEWPDGA